MSIGTVPVFPLPGLVLFPRTFLPLHVYESRYVRMVATALKGDRRIATANLKKGWDRDRTGRPPIFRTITVARILNADELPGNRYDILLEGMERAEVLDELPGKPWRIAKYRPLVEDLPPSVRDSVQESTQEMIAMAERLARRRPQLRNCLTNLENTLRHPGIIADRIASALVKEVYDRQSLLDESSVRRRVELVNVQLRSLLDAVPGGPV